MNRSAVRDLLPALAQKRILVIGDLILDEFVWGKVSRISPEAPVPVVEVSSESYFPGGAANVARNLRAFAREVFVLGVTGNCQHAQRLNSLLTQEGIRTDAIQSDSAYQTIVKTRIIARQQHVVRIDREKPASLLPEHTAVAVRHLKELLPQIDAVIVEDYGKGLLSQNLVDSICDLTQQAGKLLAVDPNPKNPLRWRHLNVIKPNRLEAFASAGIPQADPVDPPTADAKLLEVGQRLMEQWNPEHLLITLGEQGVMLFGKDTQPYHAPTRAREVFDVSGAGDTVIALFTLALSAGIPAPQAAELANHASGVVVGKLGTATVSPEELLASFDS
jgi:rfaE bifunctional protein kinase chain/domain